MVAGLLSPSPATLYTECVWFVNIACRNINCYSIGCDRVRVVCTTILAWKCFQAVICLCLWHWHQHLTWNITCSLYNHINVNALLQENQYFQSISILMEPSLLLVAKVKVHGSKFILNLGLLSVQHIAVKCIMAQSEHFYFVHGCWGFCWMSIQH